MLPVDGHASPALLPIFSVLHDKVASEVLNATPLLADGVINNPERCIEAEVEILSMPGTREEAS